ncbi:hypothetical protein CDL15_Pgr025810 [Punica granatum]|uniref:non-specific serine/threonine protein kinase n=1 Tax=Punica granatum TaxID=22663 RepID=A0A218WCN2_PUNGR|nr:hypothetical protein CDL15_Pgr025810 [Punica granatum]
MSYHSLLKATNGFSEAYFIGVGAFCSVYKGIISEGNGEVVVAVKVLNMFKQGAASSFLAECQALRNIRHRNLVKVITACSSGDGNGNDFKALVYEYMPSGSLEYWLQPALEGNQARVMKRNLSLVRRLNIAINVASALDYLHHQCETPIVHCDLKPSNILLDEEMVAHVGDFGLARFVTEGPIPTSSIGIRSSTGYVPPEYGMGSEASTLGDVYSYGILLLELFTGKRPTDEMFDESMNLHSFAKIAMVGRVKDIMDPVLVEEVSSPTYHQKTAKAWACLALIFQIGLACSAKVPRERMRIGLVVTKLASIRNKLLETDKDSVNQFSGPVPSLAKLQASEVSYLEQLPRDRISGGIPSSIGGLRGLVRLYLDCNQFTGNLPSSIGNLTLLKDLSLCSNFFQGGIPPIVLDISGNNLVGVLSAEVGNLNKLGALEVPRICYPTSNLSLLQRLRIATDVASALDYLPHHCETPIVHCDLKPNNIFLDSEMVAHVGDFGLARFIQEAADELHANQSSTICIRGLTGYVAPEYGMGSEVSTLGDVYSYGILLLELFTGKRPTDKLFNEGLNNRNFTERALSGQLEEIIDTAVFQEGQQTDQASRYNSTRAWTSNRVQNA